MKNDFTLLAHRGCSILAEENTKEAFLLATQYAKAVEFDVQLTKDHVPVVFHDENTKRMCNEDVLIRETLFKDLPKTKKGSNILEVDHALDICKNLIVHLEIKDPLAKIHLPPLNTNVVVSSFHPQVVRFFSQNHTTLFLADCPTNLEVFKSTGAVFLGISKKCIPFTLPIPREKTFIFTLNIPYLIEVAKEEGFGGVYCDCPERIPWAPL